uniref:Uncharacterized protein n=1 Tax=Arion vulgaris TaxID=1028688 RepID=A0A0B7A4S8_9EUPU
MLHQPFTESCPEILLICRAYRSRTICDCTTLSHSSSPSVLNCLATLQCKSFQGHYMEMKYGVGQCQVTDPVTILSLCFIAPVAP